MLPYLPSSPVFQSLIERLVEQDDQPLLSEIRATMKDLSDSLAEDDPLRKSLHHLADPKLGLIREAYPDDRGVVLTTRKHIASGTSWFLPALNDGGDDSSRIGREEPISLRHHTDHVRSAMKSALSTLPFDASAAVFLLAAALHDWGKADERFQAMLRRTGRTDAWLFAGRSQPILAKSDGTPQTPSERRAARVRAGLPDGFRHEMLSVQLAECSGKLPNDRKQADLILHLIAAHHGYGRPFAPVVLDMDLPGVEMRDIQISPEERAALTPSHRLDSGIPERFWALTRRFGWWGLAYLEALLRLADQQASADEDAGVYDNADSEEHAEALT